MIQDPPEEMHTPVLPPFISFSHSVFIHLSHPLPNLVQSPSHDSPIPCLAASPAVMIRSQRAPKPTLISSEHTQPGPRGLSQSHPKSQPKPWLECTPMALGMWTPSEIM